jgi:hypothetical protein
LSFSSLVISFFCFSLFSIGLLLFGNLILSAFHIHNKWQECPARVLGGGGGCWHEYLYIIHWGIWKFENFFCDGPMKEAHWKNINKIWTC